MHLDQRREAYNHMSVEEQNDLKESMRLFRQPKFIKDKQNGWTLDVDDFKDKQKQDSNSFKVRKEFDQKFKAEFSHKTQQEEFVKDRFDRVLKASKKHSKKKNNYEDTTKMSFEEKMKKPKDRDHFWESDESSPGYDPILDPKYARGGKEFLSFDEMSSQAYERFKKRRAQAEKEKPPDTRENRLADLRMYLGFIALIAAVFFIERSSRKNLTAKYVTLQEANEKSN